MLPFRGRLSVTGGGSMCFGLVSRTLGMLALALDEPATAIELLIEAVEHADRIEAISEGVASRRLLASALLATGSPEQAVIYLDEALPIAIERAYTREAMLIRELMTELNGRSATGNTTSTNATADHDDRTRVSLQP